MGKNPKIEVINIGSELLLHKLNTDIILISNILLKHNFRISKCIIVGDSREEIKKAIENSFKESDVLIITGGLGPTFDDLTREILSEFFNRELIFNESVWKKISDRFKKRGVEIPEINKKQAYIIDGSQVIENKVGTAAGMIIEEKGKFIIVLPGPPRELKPMFEKAVEKIKKVFSVENLKTVKFSISSVPESVVQTKLKDIFEKEKNEKIILAHPNLTLRLFSFSLILFIIKKSNNLTEY